MKKIIAFAGSNSSTSINHQLVTYAASLVEGAEVKLIKLTDYPLPIFSEDIEKSSGYPEALAELLNEIKPQDALIISVNEHNGGISSFFKNTLDWLSRIELKFMEGKKILCLSTSPGKRGAVMALEYTKGVVPRYGGELVTSMSFPSFYENFSEGKVTNQELSEELTAAIKALLESL